MSYFTDKQLSILAGVLFVLFGSITGYTKITESLLLSFNLKNDTNLLLINTILFGIIFYISVDFLLDSVYDKVEKFIIGVPSFRRRILSRKSSGRRDIPDIQRSISDVPSLQRSVSVGPSFQRQLSDLNLDNLPRMPEPSPPPSPLVRNDSPRIPLNQLARPPLQRSISDVPSLQRSVSVGPSFQRQLSDLNLDNLPRMPEPSPPPSPLVRNDSPRIPLNQLARPPLQSRNSQIFPIVPRTLSDISQRTFKSTSSQGSQLMPKYKMTEEESEEFVVRIKDYNIKDLTAENKLLFLNLNFPEGDVGEKKRTELIDDIIKQTISETMKMNQSLKYSLKSAKDKSLEDDLVKINSQKMTLLFQNAEEIIENIRKSNINNSNRNDIDEKIKEDHEKLFDSVEKVKFKKNIRGGINDFLTFSGIVGAGATVAGTVKALLKEEKTETEEKYKHIRETTLCGECNSNMNIFHWYISEFIDKEDLDMLKENYIILGKSYDCEYYSKIYDLIIGKEIDNYNNLDIESKNSEDNKISNFLGNIISILNECRFDYLNNMNKEELQCNFNENGNTNINYIGNIIYSFIDNPELFFDNNYYLTEQNINSNVRLDTYNIDSLNEIQQIIKSKIVSIMKKIEDKGISHCEVNVSDEQFSDLPALMYTDEDVFDYESFKKNNDMDKIYCTDKVDNTSCENIDFVCNSNSNNYSNLQSIIDNEFSLPIEDRTIVFNNELLDEQGKLNDDGIKLLLDKCKDCSCFDLSNNSNNSEPINKLLPWEIYNYLTYNLDDNEKLEFIENDCMNYYLNNLAKNNTYGK